MSKKITWRGQLESGKVEGVEILYTNGGRTDDIHTGGKTTYGYIAICKKGTKVKPNKLDLVNVHSVIEFCEKHKLDKYGGIKMDSDKSYETSSKSKEFREDWVNYDWFWVVFDWASYKEMQQIENELLKQYKVTKNDSWYNLSVGFPGVPRVRWGYLGEISKEMLWLKNYDLTDRDGNHRNFIHCDAKWLTDSPEVPVPDLYNTPKIQPRISTIDRDHLDGIKGDIKRVKGSTDGADPVMIFVDRVYKGKFYKWIIFDGNHTITAYYELENYRDVTNLKTILIPPSLHQDLSDEECKELGNDMNSLEKRKKPFTKECAKRDLLEKARKGQTWKSADILTTFMKRGLKESSINTVWDWVEQELKNDAVKEAGSNVMDYDGVHEPIVEELMEKQMRSGLYLSKTYSASSFKPDRAQVAFHKLNEERILDGKTPYKGLIINVKFDKEKTRDKTWPKLKAEIEILKVKEYKTEMIFNELEMYVDGVIDVKTICKKS